MAHEVHPKKIVKTDKGNIVLEEPDMFRKSALSNSMYTYIFTDEDLDKINEMKDDGERDRFMKFKSMRMAYTVSQLTSLSYITSAPFHLNNYEKEPILDLKSYLEFLDEDIFSEILAKIKELGLIDPLSP